MKDNQKQGTSNMDTDNAPRKTGGLLSAKQLDYYLMISGLKAKLGENDAKRFIAFALEYELNPFRREIHCFFDGSGNNRKALIVVGYEVYIKRAERTGVLDGWAVRVEGEGNAMKAIIEIHRKDWTKPFIHEVYWTEAAQKNANGMLTPFWQRMPRFQLKKVAICQGFRLCFSDYLGGIPYEAAELLVESTTIPAMVNPAMDRTLLEDKTPSDHSNGPGKDSGRIAHTALGELERFLKEKADLFTESHSEWILEKVQENDTEEKARAMLAYARKFVREHESESQGPARTVYPSRQTRNIREESAIIF